MFRRDFWLVLTALILPACGSGNGLPGPQTDALLPFVEPPSTVSPEEWHRRLEPAPLGATQELHRVLIHNVTGGEIRGSRDGGRTWAVFGHITFPIRNGIWHARKDGVFAYQFHRGPSTVFATAVNAVHLRMSDPIGYTLPTDLHTPLVDPHGLSILPKDTHVDNPDNGSGHSAYTDIAPGQLLYNGDWTPKVGSEVLMGDGTQFAPIPYDLPPNDTDLDRSFLLIVTHADAAPIQYLQIDNQVGGKVSVKRQGVTALVQFAKVIRPIVGVGRFLGSEFISKPGVLRANHAGVFEIGTTDVNTDPNLPPGISDDEKRGGFQIVPSHHFQDTSLSSGGDHAQVYLVVGPIQDPPDLLRYDRGIDGQAPLFKGNARANTGKTYFKFRGDASWYEISNALRMDKFKRADGTVVRHLRGKILDALTEVTQIRFVF